jgi:cathepsin L
MKSLLFVLAALCLVSAALALQSESDYQFLFGKWMKHHQKSYGALEFQQRFGIWKANFDYVHAHNAKNLSFTMSVNHFADLTNKEFNALYKGVSINKVPMLAHTHVPAPGLPASVDWRTRGVVTQVKNQGQCGSCWSFSSTGSIEGAHAIATGSLVSLSEQNLVDCSTAQGNQGCNGGLMDYAFQYVISNNGIDTESSYPYTATGPNQCQFSASNVGATIQNYQDVASGSESALQQAVGTVGPVSVAIDASHDSFQFYSGGVYNEPACSSTQLDHGVLSVGYGNYQGTDYWLVKNSWGASWGLNGYIMMSRNQNNQCGIATSASYPCVSTCQ